MRMSERIYLLTGPTAVGKTELALSWAESTGAEIVSCDSLLVYRGMDIGTAKPDRQQLERVRHHCIDLAPVRRRFSVGDYIRCARSAISGILGRGKRVLVAGGSGFYLKSFFAPVIDHLPIPKSLNERVERLYEEKGLEGILRELVGIDPDAEGEIDARNPRRVLNALKRCLASGQSVAELKRKFQKGRAPFDDFEVSSCCLWREIEDLRGRVERRTESMLARGLIEEVEGLLEQGLEGNESAASAIGYRETIAFIRNEYGSEGLEEAINRNTIRLIRKQGNWFRNQLPIDRQCELSGAAAGGEISLFP